MMNATISNWGEITVGDQVLIIDEWLAREIGMISAKVIEIRRILGGLAYLIETEKGHRKLVGANQIRQGQISSE